MLFVPPAHVPTYYLYLLTLARRRTSCTTLTTQLSRHSQRRAHIQHVPARRGPTPEPASAWIPPSWRIIGHRPGNAVLDISAHPQYKLAYCHIADLGRMLKSRNGGAECAVHTNSHSSPTQLIHGQERRCVVAVRFFLQTAAGQSNRALGVHNLGDHCRTLLMRGDAFLVDFQDHITRL